MEALMFKIEKAADGEIDAYERISWPFKEMSVGDVVRIDDASLQYKAQVACHVQGKKVNMKFKTKTLNGILNIWRVA
jgi:hypothetical protein